MDLYPAIDLRGGTLRAPRTRATTTARPSTATTRWPRRRPFADAGAPWIHVVDLDAARTGEPVNRDRRRGHRRRGVPVPVQTGGGVRSTTAAAALVDAGVARVVLGTAALEHPDLVRRLAAAPAGGGRPRRPRPRGGRAGLERGHRARRARRRSAGSPTPASPPWSSPRSAATARSRGPTSTASAACWRRTTVPDVIASGGVGTLDDLAPWPARGRRPAPGRGHRRAGALRGPLHAWPRRSPCSAGVGRDDRPGDPVPRRRRRPRRQGRELRRPPRRRRSGRAGGPLRRRGRRRARLPRHHRVVATPATRSSTWSRRTAEEVFIPFTVGGGIRTRRRRPPPAAGRGRQGRRQHRGGRPARAGVGAVGRVRRPVRGRRHRRPPARRRRVSEASRSTPTAAARRPGIDVGGVGGRGECSSAPARSCSRRWTATAPRTASTSTLTRAVADAVTVPVIATGGVGTLQHLVEGVTDGGADAVLAASIFHFGEHTVARPRRPWPTPGSPCGRRLTPGRRRAAAGLGANQRWGAGGPRGLGKCGWAPCW